MMPVHGEQTNPFDSETPLMEYFRLSGINGLVKRLRYVDMPCFFIWDNDLSIWQPRKRCVLISAF